MSKHSDTKSIDISVFQDQRDASSSIRGYFFQILSTLQRALELEADETLYIELGEDLARYRQDEIAFEQIKDEASPITLTTGSIQEFIVNSYALWIKSNKKSFHQFYTTSRIALESDRKRILPWLSMLEKNDFSANMLSYFRKKKCSLKGAKLATWGEIVSLKDDDLKAFFVCLQITPNQLKYESLVADLPFKIKSRFPLSDPTTLRNQLIVYLFEKSSKSGIKTLTPTELTKIAQINVTDMSVATDMIASLTDLSKNLLGKIAQDVESVKGTMKKVEQNSNQLLINRELLPVIEQMERSLIELEPDTVVNIAEGIRSKIETAANGIKYRYYLTLGKTYQQIKMRNKVADNYLKASNSASDKDEALYLGNLGLLYKEGSDSSKINEDANDLIVRSPYNKNGYKLKLITGITEITIYIGSIPDIVKQQCDIALLIAYSYLKSNDYSSAVKWAQISANNSDSKIDNRFSLIEMRLIELVGDLPIVHMPIPSKTTKDVLLTLKLELQDIWEQIRNKGLAKYRTEILKWIASIEFLTGDGIYMDTINKAITLSGDSTDNLFMKAQYLIAKGDKEGGTEILKKIPNDFTTTQSFEFSLSNNDDFETVQKKFKDYESEVGASTADGRIIYLRFIKDRIPEKLKDELEELKGGLKDDYIKYFATALENDNARVIELLKEVAEIAKRDNDRLLMDMVLGDLYKLGEKKSVIDLLDSLRNPNFFTVIDAQLIRVLKEVEVKSVLMSKLEEYIAIFGNIPLLLQEKLPLEMEIHDTSSQLDIVENLLKNDEKNVYLQILRGQLLTAQGTPFAVEELEKLCDVNIQRIEDLVNVAILFCHNDKPENGLDLLYRARRIHPYSKLINRYYNSIMITYFRENHPEWISTDVVTKDYQIVFDSQTLIIEDLGENVIIKGELSMHDKLYELLKSKRIGDTIDNFGIIRAIRHKYVASLQEIMQEPDRYLPEGMLRKFNVRLGDTPDISEIISFSVNLAKERQKIIDIYIGSEKQIPMTLNSLSRNAGRDYLDTFDFATTAKNIRIHCALGTTSEQLESNTLLKELYNNSENPVVIELSAIITLHWLGLLDKVTSIFPHLYVPPTLLELLKQWKVNHEHFNQGETRSISVENGIPIAYINNEEANVARYSRIVSLCDWVEKNTRIIPAKTVLKVRDEERKSFSNFFGEEVFDSIYLASEQSAILLSDEVTVRLYAKERNNTKGLWIQPLLQLFMSRGLISSDEYYEIVNRLVIHNYAYIQVNKDNIASIVKKADYYPSEDLQKILSVIKYSNISSASRVLADFVSWLYKEPLLPVRQDALVINILEELKILPDLPGLLELMLNGLQSKLLLYPIQLVRVERLINKWFKVLGNGELSLPSQKLIV